MSVDFFRFGFRVVTVAALLLFILTCATGSAQVPSSSQPITFDNHSWSRHYSGLDRRHVKSRQGHQGTSVVGHAAAKGPGVIETLAGTTPFQQPATALTAGLGYVTGIAVDANGNTFVASLDFRSVLKIDSSGNVTVYAGQPLGSGPVQASGDNGPATSATLVSPEGLAVDSAGNLYIADSGSYTIRMVAASTGVITTVAGTPGESGFSPDGTLAVNALLGDPSSIAIDASGNIFLVDSGVIKRLDHGTGLLAQYAGTAPISCAALSNTQTCPISTVGMEANFWPNSITISNGNLYIATYYLNISTAYYYDVILSVQLSTGATTLLAGGGPAVASVAGNTAIGAIIDPLGLAVDANGNIDFTNGSGEQVYGAATIMQLPVNGTSLTTIAGTGQVGSSGDGGAATAAELLSVLSIVVTPSGNILFTEPSRIRSIDMTGKIATFAGNGLDNYFGDGGPAQSAGLSSMEDAVVDASGNLYIADTSNGVVRRVDASTGIITTIAGNGGFADYQQGNSSSTSLPGDGGPATQTPLGAPGGLAIGSANTLYIGDFYQGIRVVDLGTGIITTLNGQLSARGTMAFDGQHTLYTTDNESVDAVDTTSGLNTVVAGNGANSFTSPGDSYGDGGPATQAYIFPNGVALDNAGNLYIADSLENGVRIVTLSTGVINSYAGGTQLTNQVYGSNLGYAGDGGPAADATFRIIAGLHYDGAGNLLLADTGNDVIREINLSNTIINTIVGHASPGYTGDGAGATSATLDDPFAASTDAAGNIYISDFDNDRIRRVVLHPVALTAALTPSVASAAAGANVTLTATYSGITYGLAPTGAVTFYDGTTSLGTGTLTASTSTPGEYVATLTTDTLAAGSQSITAQIAGDANYAAGTSSAVVVTVVAPPAPAVTLSAASLSFAAQTEGTTSAAQALTLTNSGTAALTVTSIAASGDFAETNTCGSSVAAAASCMISVTFTPTAGGARTGTLTINDNAAGTTQTVALSGRGEAVAVSSTSTGLTVASSGGTATAPIQIAPEDGFTGTVNLTCTVSYLGTGTPNESPTCSLNPSSAQVSSTSPISSTLTVSTTAASASAAYRTQWAGSAAAFAALFFLGILPRRRWRESILMAALCLVAGAAVIGCGGGSSQGGGGSGNSGTTTGNYQVVVSATSGTVSSTVTIPFAVQ